MVVYGIWNFQFFYTIISMFFFITVVDTPALSPSFIFDYVSANGAAENR